MPLDEVSIDAEVLPFTALITIDPALIVGLLPAWRLPRVSLHDAMKQSGAPSHTAGGTIAQSVPVVSQVTATAVCAIIAGVLFHSLLRVLTVDKGFDTAKIVTADLERDWAAYVAVAAVSAIAD